MILSDNQETPAPSFFEGFLCCPKDCYSTWQKLQSFKKSSVHRHFFVWNKSQQTTSFHLVVFLFAVLYILEKESKDFASCVFPSGLFVVHDASWGGQHNVSVETKVSTLTNNSDESIPLQVFKIKIGQAVSHSNQHLSRGSQLYSYHSNCYKLWDC